MKLIDVFERLVTSCIDRQKHNDRQSMTLASVRDGLLPRLISGEMRIADTERVLENA